MVQRRSRLQINVFFNTDSNKILTFGIKKATPSSQKLSRGTVCCKADGSPGRYRVEQESPVQQ